MFIEHSLVFHSARRPYFKLFTSLSHWMITATFWGRHYYFPSLYSSEYWGNWSTEKSRHWPRVTQPASSGARIQIPKPVLGTTCYITTFIFPMAGAEIQRGKETSQTHRVESDWSQEDPDSWFQILSWAFICIQVYRPQLLICKMG